MRRFKKAEDVVNACHREQSMKMLKKFDKLLKTLKSEFICALCPEITIAEYCCRLYNAYASDEAKIVFVKKPSTKKSEPSTDNKDIDGEKK